MIAVVQRVQKASVTSPDQSAQTGPGYLVLLGVGKDDTKEDAQKLAEKIIKLRLMADSQKKMNLSLSDANGELLVVSQFTLYADTSQGNRPSFLPAASADKAEKLYNYFVEVCKKDISTKTGVFGAYMDVLLINNAPVTVIIDSKDL